jgi:hypothetical protein
MEIKYGIKGDERKRLVGAISEALQATTRYCGAPTFSYEAGDYRIDKEGTVTGPDNIDLVAALRDAGFDSAGKIILDRHKVDEPVESESPDRLTVEVPIKGFTPLALQNLRQMVDAKADLLKKALGCDNLLIDVNTTEETLLFPWFTLADPADAAYYVQFVYALCNTAKTKKRVTAKPAATDNEKFSLRVWLISLGMVSDAYKKARSLLLRNMSGNSAFRSGSNPKMEVAG